MLLYGQRPGISCERLNLNLEFHKHNNQKELREKYTD